MADELKEVIESEYAGLINELLGDEIFYYLGKEITDISTITQGDVDGLAETLARGNKESAFARILDRINK